MGSPQGDPDGSIALSQRMESFAHQMLRTADVPAQAWNQSADLLKAAVKLDPSEPRYARLLADDLLSLDDSSGAIDALKHYLKLQREDQSAQVQLLDLFLAQMQSADQKIAYLRGVMDKEGIPPEVRSSAAVRCAQLLAARLQDDEAIKVLDAALVLDPLNSAAMRAKFDLTSATATPLDRVHQLLNILMSCPADPLVTTQLAQQLAEAGLTSQSIEWYSYSNGLYSMSGVRPDESFALGAASELLIADRSDDAASLLSQFVAAIPGNVNGWLLRATVAKYQADQNPADKTIQDATADIMRQTSIGLTNHLMVVRGMAIGGTPPTTQPMESQAAAPLPDLTGDPEMLRKAGRADITDDYVATVEALTWYDLYFAKDATSAQPLLDVLGKLLGDQDPQLARLRGWQEYVSGDPVAASTKFVAVQGTDPLAALGLDLIDLADPHKHDDAVSHSKRLLSAHPAGMVGATIFAALSKYDVALEHPPAADAIYQALLAFPMDFTQIVNHPQSFYIVHAEPSEFTYSFGEPVLIHVMIENISPYDIAIGPDAVLHPDLWVDASLRGMETQTFAGAAFDRFGQKLVLPVGQTVSTYVRVDDGSLNSVFFSDPRTSLTINCGIVTNPTSVRSAGAGQPSLGRSGPCGYGVQLSRMILRGAVSLDTDDAREALLQRLHDGDGGEKIRTLDILTNCIQSMRRTNEPGSQPIIDKFIAHIRQATSDETPSVSAWAQFSLGLLSTGDDQTTVISQMGQDQAHWQTRLLAMVAQAVVGGSEQLSDQLSKDSDPIVRDFAVFTAQRLAAVPPAPAPAAQTPSASP
jgi:tetratricopeptide (TPR) repeat protein